MSQYKSKTKQYVINATRQPLYIHRDDYILFNLNACFVKKNNLTRFETLLREAVAKGGTKLNLGNLASLCYKLGMDYCSDETFEFIQKVIYVAKQEDIQLTQDGILSYGEVDMCPIDNLISHDKKNCVIYTNSVLVDCLKILGYVDSQIRDIINVTKDFRKIIPEDLIEELPTKNRKTIKAYERIKKLI